KRDRYDKYREWRYRDRHGQLEHYFHHQHQSVSAHRNTDGKFEWHYNHHRKPDEWCRCGHMDSNRRSGGRQLQRAQRDVCDVPESDVWRYLPRTYHLVLPRSAAVPDYEPRLPDFLIFHPLLYSVSDEAFA